MQKVMIVGAGDVAKAATVKILKTMDVPVIVVSRSQDNLNSLYNTVMNKTGISVETHVMDVAAAPPEKMDYFVSRNGITTIMNLASPYTNLVLMDLALRTCCDYLDTACYEKKGTKGFSYEEQLQYYEAFRKEGLVALLGAGGSPGVTNALARYCSDTMTGRMNNLQIRDGNAGHQDKYRFCTNFSPEDNLKELDNPATYWTESGWNQEPSFSTWVRDPEHNLDYYRIFHEELLTLTDNFPDLIYAECYMSFGEDYINCFKVLQDLGLLSHTKLAGHPDLPAPIEYLAKVLPKPQDVAKVLTGKAYITVQAQSDRGDTKALQFVMDHEACYEDTGTGAVAWSTGVPAVAFLTLLSGMTPGVWTPEQIDSVTTMPALCKYLYIQELDVLNGKWHRQ